ncbi:MAG: methyltransferase domain-containing protein [Planctomycetes bacterium]|nr:methyltransferase domain-containing protein [Planctomycetota bacterium]
MLDLACGGGDVTIGIARRARQSGLRVQVDGCDISPLAIQFARERLRAESLKGMHFFTLDVLRDPLPEGYDVVMASLFLHHLDNEQAVEMLRRMAEAARRMALVHDLRRTSAGYVLAWVGCRIAARCRVNHLDGPLSVRASFREAEIERLAADAGWHGAQFVRCWPQRFLLSWQKGE